MVAALIVLGIFGFHVTSDDREPSVARARGADEYERVTSGRAEAHCGSTSHPVHSQWQQHVAASLCQLCESAAV